MVLHESCCKTAMPKLCYVAIERMPHQSSPTSFKQGVNQTAFRLTKLNHSADLIDILKESVFVPRRFLPSAERALGNDFFTRILVSQAIFAPM